ncbi:rhodanese-like domain-containing protein [Anaeromyxobacter oryzae]|uniref:Sulfurtransferase n=1 Tax=Anaeromyxobacter oryzae TaxID=2918170 RepID=A0ABM7X2J7_9BACT|nr:rhodanese-like domain-containing protein [Anaeromyxobacter oryzae]BDG06007.1 sulfurtransferase [Anaeromyxobacter oryzae]
MRVLVAVAAVFALTACPHRPQPPPEQKAGLTAPAVAPAPAPGLVDGATAKRLVAGGARLVDVRTPQEYAEGHPAGAVNIPYDEIARRAAELGGPDTGVVVYCGTGRRSGIAAHTLRDLGYTSVYDMQRVTAWPEDGGAGPLAQ